jgi:ankyrin repeat protein
MKSVRFCAGVCFKDATLALVAAFFLQCANIGHSQNHFKPGEEMEFLGAIQTGQDLKAAAMLEENTNLVFGVDNLTKRALLEAAAGGNVHLVKRMLELGADIDAPGDILCSAGSQRTALHFAIQNNHLEVCKVLLESGADPKQMAFGFETPLHLAFKGGHEDAAGLLLDYGAEPFQGKLFSNDETTPFELAITQGNGKLVPRMLGQEPKNPLGAKAIQKPRHSKLPPRGLKTSAEVLLQHGEDLLIAAAQRGELEAVQALLRAGVSAKNANIHCPTILQSFSISSVEAARALPSTIEQWHRVRNMLKADNIPHADPNFIASFRNQEAGLAAEVEALNPERRQKILELLIRHGANYDAFAATALDDANQTKRLVAADKNVARLLDCTGQSLLHVAVLTDRPRMVAFWIAAGTPLAVTNSAGQTALHLAAAGGKADLVKALLDAHAPTNGRDTNGWTPLDAAIQAKQAECIHLLLPDKISPAHPERGLATALHEAATAGNIAALAALLDTETNLEARNELGLTPLQLAVTKGHLAAAALLVDKGADLNARDPDGNSLLHQIFLYQYIVYDRPARGWLAHLKESPQKGIYVKNLTVGQYEQGPNPLLQGTSFLLACGLDAKATNHAGKTVMQLVTDDKIGRGIFFFNDDREQLIKLLGGAGGNLEERDANGNTVLHRSVNGVDAGDIDRLASIIASGADVNATNGAGQTPLHIAASKIYGWDGNKPGTNEAFQMLVYMKANVNAQDNDGRTPLHVLAAADTSFKQEATQLLVDSGANPNLQDHDGFTPLHLVASSGLAFNEGMVQCLLDAGANPNIQDKRGRTPVHVFLSGSWPWNSASQSLQKLAKAKADFSIKDNEGKTPLHYLAALGSQKPLFFIHGIDGIFVEKKVDFQARDNKGNTPLDIAAKSGTHDVFDWLVKQGASLDTTNNNGETARLVMAHAKDSSPHFGPAAAEIDIFQAASQGNVDAAARLLKADSRLVNQTNQFQQTPLRVAVTRRQTNMVNFLETSGAKWDEGSAVLAGRTDVLQVILKQNPSAIDARVLGKPLIHIAAANGDVSTAKMLIAANCDLQARDTRGLSALGYALIKDRKDMQELLLQHGAKENSFDAVYANDLKTVKELLAKDASRVSSSERDRAAQINVAAAAGYTNILKLLLKHETGTNAAGRSSAQVAAFFNQADALALLIHMGVNVNQVDQHGFAPLHWASIRGSTEAAALLLKRKADPNQAVALGGQGSSPIFGPDRRTIMGDTPLHLAALGGKTNMVQLLLKSGADVNAVNAAHLTPLDLTVSMRTLFLNSGFIYRNMLDLLEPLGVDQAPENQLQDTMDGRKTAAALIKAAGGKHSQFIGPFGGGLILR